IGSRVHSANAIECLVRAGGHDDALRAHAHPGSERRLDRRRIGVAAQHLRIQGCQLREQGLWWPRPLIAVEAEYGHGTICERVETTTSVPPAAFTAGITCGKRSRGTAAFTAYPVSPNRRDTVACRIDGSTATTASRQAAEAFTSSITRRRASSTELISKTRSSMKRRRTGSSSAAWCAYRRVDERINTSTIARPFASSVAPVAVLSTITSASSGGNTSVAPYERTNSAQRPLALIQRRASRSYSDATIRRRLGSCPPSSNATGAAATSCTGSSPVSSNSTTSAPPALPSS